MITELMKCKENVLKFCLGPLLMSAFPSMYHTCVKTKPYTQSEPQLELQVMCCAAAQKNFPLHNHDKRMDYKTVF